MRLSKGKEGGRYRVLNYNSLSPYYVKKLEALEIYPGTVLILEQRTRACCAIVSVEGNDKWQNVRINLAKKLMVEEL